MLSAQRANLSSSSIKHRISTPGVPHPPHLQRPAVLHTPVPLPTVSGPIIVMSGHDQYDQYNPYNPYNPRNPRFRNQPDQVPGSDGIQDQPDTIHGYGNVVLPYVAQPHVLTQSHRQPSGFSNAATPSLSSSQPNPGVAQQDARSPSFAGASNTTFYSQSASGPTHSVHVSTRSHILATPPHPLSRTGQAQSSQGHPQSGEGDAGSGPAYREFTFTLDGQGVPQSTRNIRPCSQCQRAQSKVRSSIHRSSRSLTIALRSAT